ncbi:hypothetical protein ABPG74_017815 [Tetrahymena malaccensis]
MDSRNSITLPPSSQQNLNKLALQDSKDLNRKQNRRSISGSSNASLGSISFFQSEYDATNRQKSHKNIKRISQITKITEVNDSDEFAGTFGNSSMFENTKNSQGRQKSFDYKKFNQVFQDDLSYLIRYAVTSNAQKYSLSPHKMQEMKEEAQGKKVEKKPQKNEKKKKQNNFIDRNYNKYFQSQQKIYDKNREIKKQMREDAENNYEKVDPAVWKTSLAIMKYQVAKDTYQIENSQRQKNNEYSLMEFKTAEQKYHEQNKRNEDQKIKDRARKGPQSRAVSVKITLNDSQPEDAYKKQVFKSDDQVEKDVRRLAAITQRNDEKDNRKINNYFIRIQRRLQMLYRMQPSLEKEQYRNTLMTELRDNEKLFQSINDQIIGKYEDFLVEKIIDDILIENVMVLQYIEQKQKMTKKQLRQATLNEFKQCFLEYFDDAQCAALNLVYAGKPIPKKVIHYDHVLLEVGYGLLLSTIDQKNKYNIYRSHLDYSDKNNVSLLNLIARDIALELVDEVAETFDQLSQEFTNQIFVQEFQ